MPQRCRHHEKLRAIEEGLRDLADESDECPEWHHVDAIHVSDFIEDFSSAGLRAFALGLEVGDLPGYGTGLDLDDMAGLTLMDASIALVIG